MYQGQYIFTQIVEIIPRHDFDQYVKKYNGNKGIRRLTCHDQLLALMFGQLTNKKSIRGVVICLNAHATKLYHLGFRTNKLVATTLSRANHSRNWKIYRDLAYYLIEQARSIYQDDNEFDLDLEGTPYVLDSTVISLCLSLFPWAKYKGTKSGVKVHTVIDLRGNIPSFFEITEAKCHDVNYLDVLVIEEGSYYIMDRGYQHFKRLYRIHKQKAFFIVRAKKGLSFKCIESRKVDKSTGLRCDQTIKLQTYQSKKDYPETLRRVKFYDTETDTIYVYLTNNFDLEAEVIVKLYIYRWQIELFFKWIKQHLHIEVFWGRTENAVKLQICIALCTFLTVAILKKRLKIDRNIHEILEILSVSQFVKEPINNLLSEKVAEIINDQSEKQALLPRF